MGEHEGHSHDISNIKGVNLFIVVVLNFLITIAQVIGGIFSGSLALISDALHNLSDAVAIIISYIAIKISKKDNDEKRTFGYRRAGILAAFVNSSFLIIISFFLFKEAITRFLYPQNINAPVLITVALVGLLANIVGVFLLRKGSTEDMNIKSSYLHLLADAFSSVAVVIGGILIYFFNIYWIDPLLTILIGAYVLKESYEIIKESTHFLMQGVPKNVNVEEIAKALSNIENIEKVHHVHVWGMDERNIYFEAHINIIDMMVSDTKEIFAEVEHQLLHFGINHVTIQFEYDCCEGVDIIKK